MSTPYTSGALPRQFEAMREQVDDMFRSLGLPANIRAASRESYPPVNVGSCPDSVEVVALVPGLDPAAIEVTIDKGLLTLSGERVGPANEKGRTFYARERAAGKFQRVIELPQDADPDNVTARYVDGCLSVSVKKRESSKPRAIPVQ